MSPKQKALLGLGVVALASVAIWIALTRQTPADVAVAAPVAAPDHASPRVTTTEASRPGPAVQRAPAPSSVVVAPSSIAGTSVPLPKVNSTAITAISPAQATSVASSQTPPVAPSATPDGAPSAAGGTAGMIAAHASLRAPEYANPDSETNRRVQSTMMAKAFARLSAASSTNQ